MITEASATSSKKEIDEMIPGSCDKGFSENDHNSEMQCIKQKFMNGSKSSL